MASLDEDFRAFADAPASVVDGALLVSRLIYPETDSAWCRNRLRLLAREVATPASPASLLASLRQAGFRGADHYYDAENSALECVLRTQRGIPISLAVVLLGVAEPLGITGVGINFPGHFLVSLDDQLADPFTLALIEDREREERILASGVPAPQALRPANPIDLVLRMLNNLRSLATSRNDHAQALELTEFQLLLANDSFPLLMARAESWFGLGATTQAVRELERALAVAPDDTMAQRITSRLRELAAQRRTLH